MKSHPHLGPPLEGEETIFLSLRERMKVRVGLRDLM